MLCDSDIKEELNYAYVHAVAAAAGCTCDRPGKDRDSMDCIITAPGLVANDSLVVSPIIGIQLKATVMKKPTSEYFSFDLKVKNYNDLRLRRTYPTLLIIYAMPTDKRDWLTHTEDGLTSRNCAYWCNLWGLPETLNDNTQVVHVPSTNHFSSNTLEKMMYKASKYEGIGYGF